MPQPLRRTSYIREEQGHLKNRERSWNSQYSNHHVTSTTHCRNKTEQRVDRNRKEEQFTNQQGNNQDRNKKQQ
eukprot:12918410-Prorocentrum_lima.AAC.1